MSEVDQDYQTKVTGFRPNGLYLEMAYLDRLTVWIKSHPGMFAYRNANGTPVIQIECVKGDVSNEEKDTWTEYSTVWSLKGARDVIGY